MAAKSLPALKELLLERMEAGLVLRSDIRRWNKGSGYLERAKWKKKIIVSSFSQSKPRANDKLMIFYLKYLESSGKQPLS